MMKKLVSVAAILLLIAGLLSGCSLLEKLGLQESPDDELRPVSSVVIGEAEAGKFTDKTPIRLYFANEDNTKLKLEIRYIDSEEAKKSTSNLASIIVKELIKGPSDETTFKRTIPAEATLRTPVSIDNKVAVVDMSKEFKTKHPGGKDAEKMTIYSIVNSLTELDGIEKVKFKIAGKEQKEYMGNFQFNLLFPRSTNLISKEVAEPDAGAVEDGAEKDNAAAPGNNKNDSAADGQNGDSTEAAGQKGDEGLPVLE